MNDNEINDIQVQRNEIFWPSWFRKLLRGQLSLGDTFWIGNIGVGLIFAPIGFLLPLLLAPFGLYSQGMILFTGALACYWACLSRAVFMKALKTPQVGGWRWAGVAMTVLNFLYLILFLIGIFVAGR